MTLLLSFHSGWRELKLFFGPVLALGTMYLSVSSGSFFLSNFFDCPEVSPYKYADCYLGKTHVNLTQISGEGGPFSM